MSRSQPQQNQKRRLVDRKQLVGFGKYAKTTVQDVLDNDWQYILWLEGNTDIEIASDILREADENNHPDHEFKNWTSRA